MAIADIPTSFGSSFFIKTFLPGFVASILGSCAVMPIIASSFWASLTVASKLILWIISGIVFGMVITSLDLYIYQFFEGIRFWPEPIRRWKYKRIRKQFEKIDEKLEEVEDGIREIRKIRKKKGQNEKDKEELQELYYKSSELWAEVRKFPYNPDKGFYSRRYPDDGMHMMVFWPHLWFILPKELKDDLDLRGAKVDCLVYFAFIFLSYIFIGGLGFFVQQKPLVAIISIFVSLFLCFFFYRISIQAHNSYGGYIKAIFDIYRVDLAKKLKAGIVITNLIPNDAERKSWRKYLPPNFYKC
jgi:ABC-type multidrug transport system fused ATPase/permease subunit